eukprot:GHVN01015139.1.p1 GENE.GHVN01015139.1~~GHVN01015139.1.p1  ORF type:complete len:112 (+),score=27.95 GHVN01015139.1:491-826(+)
MGAPNDSRANLNSLILLLKETRKIADEVPVSLMTTLMACYAITWVSQKKGGESNDLNSNEDPIVYLNEARSISNCLPKLSGEDYINRTLLGEPLASAGEAEIIRSLVGCIE